MNYVINQTVTDLCSRKRKRESCETKHLAPHVDKAIYGCGEQKAIYGCVEWISHLRVHCFTNLAVAGWENIFEVNIIYQVAPK